MPPRTTPGKGLSQPGSSFRNQSAAETRTRLASKTFPEGAEGLLPPLLQRLVSTGARIAGVHYSTVLGPFLSAAAAAAGPFVSVMVRAWLAARPAVSCPLLTSAAACVAVARLSLLQPPPLQPDEDSTWVQNVVIWTVTVMPSGGNKSAAHSLIYNGLSLFDRVSKALYGEPASIPSILSGQASLFVS